MERHLLPLGLLLLTLSACGKQEPAATVPQPPAEVRSPTGAAVDPGELKYATICAGCHGRLGQGIGAFPKLAGKSAAELTEKLKKYRAGEVLGPQSATMKPFAMPLANDDIAQISAYVSGL